MELPHPLQMNIQFRKLHLLIQHFVVLQLGHTTFITQSLKEIHSGRETGLIDTGPLFLYRRCFDSKAKPLEILKICSSEFYFILLFAVRPCGKPIILEIQNARLSANRAISTFHSDP